VAVRESDQQVFVADITKAKDVLGWEPEVVPSQGISQMIEWMK
jgi:CDP-paratose 2-epimerase